MKSHLLHTLKRLALISTGAVLLAFNLNTFVSAANLLPGGFMGVVLLIQEIALRYWGFQIPFSILFYVLNIIPAIVCFIHIGKKFTLYSILMILLVGFLTDWMPSMFIDFIQLHDVLLAAVFGGVLCAVAISLCLYADATSGGTDFIALYISEKYRKDAWNYIFAGNCVILIIAGVLFSLDIALYSIIFQYVTTVSLKFFYKNYQQKSLFIITNKPDEVSAMIYEKTRHGATSFDGTGSFEKAHRVLLYSVVTATEVKMLIPEIRKIDDDAFINVIKTEQLNGRFYQKPKD